MKYILAIAGSDSCGGAGIQADIKTVTSLDAHALTVITAVTAQNSQSVAAIHEVPAGMISKQLETILDDVRPDAVKIGMLYTRAAIEAVIKVVERHHLPHVVVDPILMSSTGRRLLEAEAIPIMKEELFPLAKAVTPNLYEAGVLAGLQVKSLRNMEEAARVIKRMGPDVVITGGHLEDHCTDLLYDGTLFHRYSDTKIHTKHTHGSGCVFSTALATMLAAEGDVASATKKAHNLTRYAIMNGYPCGHGAGPVRSSLGTERASISS